MVKTFPVRLFLQFLKDNNIVSQNCKIYSGLIDGSYCSIMFYDNEYYLGMSIGEDNKILGDDCFMQNEAVIKEFLKHLNTNNIKYDFIEPEDKIIAYEVIEDNDELKIIETHYSKNDCNIIEKESIISIIDYKGNADYIFDTKNDAVNYCKKVYSDCVSSWENEIEDIKENISNLEDEISLNKKSINKLNKRINNMKKHLENLK